MYYYHAIGEDIIFLYGLKVLGVGGSRNNYLVGCHLVVVTMV